MMQNWIALLGQPLDERRSASVDLPLPDVPATSTLAP